MGEIGEISGREREMGGDRDERDEREREKREMRDRAEMR